MRVQLGWFSQWTKQPVLRNQVVGLGVWYIHGQVPFHPTSWPVICLGWATHNQRIVQSLMEKMIHIDSRPALHKTSPAQNQLSLSLVQNLSGLNASDQYLNIMEYMQENWLSPTWRLQLMTIELGWRARWSTSSIPTTSILLYTYTHLIYFQFPSIRSSTVASFLKRICNTRVSSITN
jgi:hypothetical protein